MQSPARYIDLRRQRLSLLSSRLSAVHQRKLSQSRQRYVALAAKLDAMSPLKVLGRGYAMVRQEDGGLVQSVRQVEPGDALNITLCDGVLRAEITEKKERF